MTVNDNASMIDELMEEYADELTPWECEFLEDILSMDDIDQLSPGQQSKLEEIFEERTA